VSSAPEPTCVLCRKRPIDPRYRPFCSERCRLIDLARWADGSYSIPGDRVDPDALPDSDQTDRS
jgi:endogenous inhibitor of DNA gyrase (YacG/DUF329 family)